MLSRWDAVLSTNQRRPSPNISQSESRAGCRHQSTFFLLERNGSRSIWSDRLPACVRLCATCLKPSAGSWYVVSYTGRSLACHNPTFSYFHFHPPPSEMLFPTDMVGPQTKLMHQIDKFQTVQVSDRNIGVRKTINDVCTVVQDMLKEVEVQESRFNSSLSLLHTRQRHTLTHMSMMTYCYRVDIMLHTWQKLLHIWQR